MNAIEAYASATSVAPGQSIGFHVRSEAPHFALRVRIYRVGRVETLVHEGVANATAYPTPANAYAVGCGWPVAYSTTIPNDWRSGAYIARFSSLDVAAEVLFVVKSAAPGANAKILFELTFTTAQAYNRWGGGNLYDGDAFNKVSFARPMDLAQFRSWELPFITWLENNGFEADYATSLDLHGDPNLLNRYRLMLSVGHDEYWSKEMRDNVEAFIGNGGNVAFFSGNVCWWQIRLEDQNRTMVCYRDAREDPLTGVDDRRVTVNWRGAPVHRPENSLTGVSYVNGAGWWKPEAGPRPAVNYVVRFGRHWVFERTGLNDGSAFGGAQQIIGYEVDAALFEQDNANLPRATGKDGSPENFLVLATADCTAWQPAGYSGLDGHSGRATMGIHRNSGYVFTAATTDWANGLTGGWNAVTQITQNVLRRLSGRSPASQELENRGFEKWAVATTPDGWSKEGPGTAAASEAAARNGRSGLLVDATPGQTWLSQGFQCEGGTYYRAGCWARSSQRGATLRLQSTATWRDFATAEHSGSGQWEYLSAVGKLDEEAPLVPSRVKLQVAAGVTASFDDVSVDAI